MTDIELVKSRLDIVQLLSSYIELKRAGSNYKALCPFHQEKSPSFMVNPQIQIYKCFGCGKSGDVISFIQEMEHLDFPVALQQAAEKAGVELSGTAMKKDKKVEEEKKKIVEAHTLTTQFYHYLLTTHKIGKPGRDYAQKRLIGSKEIQTFMFGYAPSGRDNLKKFLLKKGFDEQLLVKWGLLVERNGENIDKFRNRLLQPIRNLKGEIVGFSGRYIGASKDVPKYLNSPETLVYKKNEMLYGLFEAKEAIRKHKKLIIVEGNIDIVSSHRAGIEYIAAPLGTAFTPAQARLIKRMVDEVYFAFDSDAAGQNALLRSLKILEDEAITHKVVDITGYQDADEMICKNMAEWQKRVEEPVNTVENILKNLEEGLDLGDPDDKNLYERRAIPVLAVIKNVIQEASSMKSVSFQLGYSEEILREKVQNYKKVSSSVRVEPQKEVNITQYKDNFRIQKKLLSLLKSFNNSLPFDISNKIMPNEDFTILLEIITELRSDIPQSVKDGLSDTQLNILEDISLEDTSDIDNPISLIRDLYCRVYEDELTKRNYQNNLKYANDPENETFIKIVQEISIEKRELERIKKLRIE